MHHVWPRWLRQSHLVQRRSVYCDDHPHEAPCSIGVVEWEEALGLLLGLIGVYLSMYVAEGMGEALVDKLEYEVRVAVGDSIHRFLFIHVHVHMY